MCGIGGFYRISDRPIEAWQIITMANNLEYRGNDATGVALQDDEGNIEVIKQPEPAWKFTATKGFRAWLADNLSESTRIAIIHTRKATKGNPHKNENNHPMFGGKGAVVHNGMIFNDDGLFERNKELPCFKRSAETDSDAIRAVLDNWMSSDERSFDPGLIREMGILEGVAAIAAIHPKAPGKLLLLRDSNPLMIGATADMIAFASDKHSIHTALKPWVIRHGMPMQVHAPDISFLPVHNETGWIIGPGGYECHAEFKCNGRRRGGNLKYGTNVDYLERHKRFVEDAKKQTNPSKDDSSSKEDLRGGDGDEPAKAIPVGTRVNPTTKGVIRISAIPEWVVCPNSQCNTHLEVASELRKLSSLSYLKCGTCGRNLTGACDGTMEPTKTAGLGA